MTGDTASTYVTGPSTSRYCGGHARIPTTARRMSIWTEGTEEMFPTFLQGQTSFECPYMAGFGGRADFFFQTFWLGAPTHQVLLTDEEDSWT
jgi:hypothetical protein